MRLPPFGRPLQSIQALEQEPEYAVRTCEGATSRLGFAQLAARETVELVRQPPPPAHRRPGPRGPVAAQRSVEVGDAQRLEPHRPEDAVALDERGDEPVAGWRRRTARQTDGGQRVDGLVLGHLVLRRRLGAVGVVALARVIPAADLALHAVVASAGDDAGEVLRRDGTSF